MLPEAGTSLTLEDHSRTTTLTKTTHAKKGRQVRLQEFSEFPTLNFDHDKQFDCGRCNTQR